MNVQFPSVFKSKEAGLTKYLADLTLAIQSGFRWAHRTDEAVAEVLLVSPNGSVYAVTVDDDGNLETTARFTA